LGAIYFHAPIGQRPDITMAKSWPHSVTFLLQPLAHFDHTSGPAPLKINRGRLPLPSSSLLSRFPCLYSHRPRGTRRLKLCFNSSIRIYLDPKVPVLTRVDHTSEIFRGQRKVQKLLYFPRTQFVGPTTLRKF